MTVGALVAALWPSLGWQTIPANPLLAAAGGALLTAGFIRTDRLLRRRQRAGLHLAAFCLAGALASSVAGGWNWIATGIPLLGLVLCASVWRHLD
ncbi:MAG: hypothetical protein JWM41_882 [Gemmatimonadetes bacterium]|nr:hypothetical protein [Gemmatimonadota bacterium]